MNELKNCPFCGSQEVSYWYKEVRFGRIAYIECDVCRAKSRAFRYLSQEEELDVNDIGAMQARDAWNRRS